MGPDANERTAIIFFENSPVLGCGLWALGFGLGLWLGLIPVGVKIAVPPDNQENAPPLLEGVECQGG